MIEKPAPDWDPKFDSVLENQIVAYDDMRRRCPLAYSTYLNCSLFKHEDVMRALRDHETFSNSVSSHPSVPSGMDRSQHTLYRRISANAVYPVSGFATLPLWIQRHSVPPHDTRQMGQSSW